MFNLLKKFLSLFKRNNMLSDKKILDFENALTTFQSHLEASIKLHDVDPKYKTLVAYCQMLEIQITPILTQIDLIKEKQKELSVEIKAAKLAAAQAAAQAAKEAEVEKKIVRYEKFSSKKK